MLLRNSPKKYLFVIKSLMSRFVVLVEALAERGRKRAWRSGELVIGGAHRLGLLTVTSRLVRAGTALQCTLSQLLFTPPIILHTQIDMANDDGSASTHLCGKKKPRASLD